MIDCILCIRDESGKYYINAYITLLSIFENTSRKIRVHVLHDDSIQHGRTDLEELCSQYGHEILFHRVPDFDPETATTLSKWFSIGATYRFFAHELVKADKAVYLDCDIVVNRKIEDLYDISLSNHLIAASLDHSTYWKNGKPRKQYRHEIDYFGWWEDTYFCSGVMLMNLARMRELSKQQGQNIFVKRTLEAINDGLPLRYPDQEILNAVCASVPDGVLVLDQSFDLWHNSWGMSLHELEGKIIHYTLKPDKNFFPVHLLFWKYYAKSPFFGDMIERMDAAYSSSNMNFVRAYLRNSKRRRKAKDFMNLGFWGMLGKALKRAIKKI